MKIHKIERQKKRILHLGFSSAGSNLHQLFQQFGRFQSLEKRGLEALWECFRNEWDADVIIAHNYRSLIYAKMAQWLHKKKILGLIHYPNRNFMDKWTRSQLKIDQWVSDFEFKNYNSISPALNMEDFERQENPPSSCFFAKTEIYLDEFSGVDFLLKAVQHFVHSSEFISSHRDFRLYIVGDGPQKKALIQKAKDLEISRFVQFDAPQNAPADVFMFAGKKQGLPLAMLRAVAQGLSILSTQTGDVKSIVKDQMNGFLCQENDLEDFVENLQRFVLNPALLQMGSHGPSILGESFHASRIHELWTKMLEPLFHSTEKIQEESIRFMPWEMPKYWLENRAHRSLKKRRKRSLSFCLTASIEAYSNTEELAHESSHGQDFMERFAEFCHFQGIRSTAFIQRDWLEPMKDHLALWQEKGNENALLLRPEEAANALERMKYLRYTREFALAHQLHFQFVRFSGMDVQAEDFPSLHQMGFDHLATSINPIPHTDWRFGLPFGKAESFNLKNILAKNPVDLVQSIHALLKKEQENGVPAYLIFECKSWEFTAQNACDYASGENYSHLAQYLRLLQENFDVEFITLSEFYSRLKKKTHEVQL